MPYYYELHMTCAAGGDGVCKPNTENLFKVGITQQVATVGTDDGCILVLSSEVQVTLPDPLPANFTQIKEIDEETAKEWQRKEMEESGGDLMRMLRQAMQRAEQREQGGKRIPGTWSPDQG